MKRLLIILLAIASASCTKMGTGEDPAIKSISANDGKPTWTFMVYMNGDNSLSNYTDLDIAEMSKIDFKGNVNIIVLWDKRYTKTKLLKLNYQNPYITNNPPHTVLTATINGQTLSPTSSVELDMLSETTLSDFVSFSKANYPANHYALLFWSHSDGWRSVTSKGLQSDEDSNSNAYRALTNKKMATALFNQSIDVIIFDSCLQGSLETLWAFQKQNAAKILVASPNTIPAYGNEYTKFFSGFMNTDRSKENMALQFVQAYATFYNNTSETSIVAYNLLNFDTAAFASFFAWLKASGGVTAFNLFRNLPDLGSDAPNVKNFYDYVSASNYPSKSTVLTLLDSMILSGWRQEVGNNFKGLGIYSPYLVYNYSDEAYSYTQTYFTTYSQNDLSLDTVWDDVITLWHGY